MFSISISIDSGLSRYSSGNRSCSIEDLLGDLYPAVAEAIDTVAQIHGTRYCTIERYMDRNTGGGIACEIENEILRLRGFRTTLSRNIPEENEAVDHLFDTIDSAREQYQNS